FRPSPQAPAPRARRVPVRPRVEPLEERLVPSIVFHDDMEGGPNGWTTGGDSGLWHQTEARANSGSVAWAYTQEAWTGPRTYDTGYWVYDWEGGATWVSTANAGTLTSPPIDLTGETRATLTFAEWGELGFDWSLRLDHAAVLVSADGT